MHFVTILLALISKHIFNSLFPSLFHSFIYFCFHWRIASILLDFNNNFDHEKILQLARQGQNAEYHEQQKKERER